MRDATFDQQMYDDLVAWRDGPDQETAQRVVELIELVIEHPKEGRGRPKRLSGLPGVWSRRITQHHRLFYAIEDGGLRFISCRGHDFPEHLRADIRDR